MDTLKRSLKIIDKPNLTQLINVSLVRERKNIFYRHNDINFQLFSNMEPFYIFKNALFKILCVYTDLVKTLVIMLYFKTYLYLFITG